MVKDKKNSKRLEEEEKVEKGRIWLEDLDVTPGAKALLILAYN